MALLSISESDWPAFIVVIVVEDYSVTLTFAILFLISSAGISLLTIPSFCILGIQERWPNESLFLFYPLLESDK